MALAKAYLLGATIVSGVTMAVQPAGAQTAAGQGPTTGVPSSEQTQGAIVASTNSAGAEIVVTAQRRAGTLSRTPVAVSVLTSEVLVKKAITTESDLQIASPGLLVRQGQNSNQINYAIRGQSLDAFSGTRPGVLPYVDEVQVGGNAGASAFYDLQSVQVLKGPQGTLFGRNATGGAVLFTTQRPTDTLSGYIMGRLGNYNLRYVEGAVNVPIVDDKILLRVAGVYQKRDGFQYDDFKGGRNGDVDRYGVRASLTIMPVDGVKNELVVDYFHAGGNSTVGVVDSLLPNSLVPVLALSNFGNQTQFNGLINAFTGGAAGCNATTNNCAAAFAAANPKLDPDGLVSFLATQKARGPYISDTAGPYDYVAKNWVVSNITTIDITPDLQFRNVIGYTHLYNLNPIDVDGSAYPIDYGGTTAYHTTQFSEEPQFQGKALGGKLSYVVGAFYSKETSNFLQGGFVLSFPYIGSTQAYYAKNTNETFAGYGQGTYDLSELTGVKGLGITAGLRYTSEKVGYHALPNDASRSDPPAVQATYNFDQSKRYNNLSWTFGLQEQADAHTLFYIASRRSYRNGGYNDSERPIVGLGIEGGNGYDTERVTDVEIGTKYSGRLGSMPLHANLALYNNWIENSQRVAYTLVGGAPAAVTVNVPTARVRGVEFDASIDLTSWLQIGGAVNYTDAKFLDDVVSIQNKPVVLGTYPDTPKWSGTGYAEVNVPLGGGITGTVRGDVYGQTKTWFTSSGNTNPEAQTPGYDLVNFRVGIASEHSGWSLSGLVKNAFNHTYYVGGIALAELFGFNTIVPGDRRTFLIEARKKF